MSDSSSSSPTPWRRISDVAIRIKRSRVVRAAVIVVAALIILPGIAYGFPKVVGEDRSFLVLSGSMVPTFRPGDIIFDSAIDPADVEVGDVITFRAASGSTELFTHRVIEVLHEGNEVRWRTQGDANEDPDPFVIHQDMLVAKYDFHIPWWGLLIKLIKSRTGYLTFIVLPAAIVILTEFVKLYREMDAADRARKLAKAAKEEAP